MINIAQDEHVTVAVNMVVQAGERYGVVRSIAADATDGRTHYVELYSALGDGRYCWSGVYFKPEQLTARPDIPRPIVVLSALDQDMATLDADTISHNRMQQERTLFYVNGY